MWQQINFYLNLIKYFIYLYINKELISIIFHLDCFYFFNGTYFLPRVRTFLMVIFFVNFIRNHSVWRNKNDVRYSRILIAVFIFLTVAFLFPFDKNKSCRYNWLSRTNICILQCTRKQVALHFIFGNFGINSFAPDFSLSRWN